MKGFLSKFSRRSSDDDSRKSRRDSSKAENNTNSSSWNKPSNPFSASAHPSNVPADVPPEAPPAYTPSAPAPAPAQASSSSLQPGLAAPRRSVSPAISLASVTSVEDRYAFLTSFDTVFVIDDSGSMHGRSWNEVKNALRAITPICTSHDADGIDVYFLNHRSGRPGGPHKPRDGYTNITDAAQVERLFTSVSPNGATPIGTKLHHILKPYMDNLARNPSKIDDIKPVNIIVITDGVATDDPESVIVQHAKKLDKLEAPAYQVGIQFFQVGNQRGAAEALKELDDDLVEQGVRDMVDTIPWNDQEELSADGILKVVLGAVVRKLDRKASRRLR